MVQHEQAATGTRPPAEILHHQMAVQRRHAFGKQHWAELHQRIRQHDVSLQPARAEVDRPLLVEVHVRTRGQRGELLQLGGRSLARPQVRDQRSRLVQVAGRGGGVIRALRKLVLALPFGLDHGPEIQFRRGCLRPAGKRGETPRRFVPARDQNPRPANRPAADSAW